MSDKYVPVPDPDDPDAVPPDMRADTPYSQIPEDLRPPKYPNRLPPPKLKRHKLTKIQQEHIEWLCTPPELRVPRTTNEWFRERGLDSRLGRDWKQTPYFVKAWNQRLRSLQVDPANIDAVMNALRDRALAGDVRASVEWLKIAHEFYPTTTEDESDEQEDLIASELSDEELQALIAEGAQDALIARQEAAGGPEGA